MYKRDIARLRAIPIDQVAHALGLELKRTGRDTWNVTEGIGSNRCTSLTLFESSNRWKRWSGKNTGGVSQGSTIDLVMHIHAYDFEAAIQFLSVRFL